MEMKNSGVQLTEDVIAEFEKEFNIMLPQDYRKFMLKNNGGKPVPVDRWNFSFIENGTDTMTDSIVSFFEKFYSEKTTKDDDLKEGYAALLRTEQIPANLLPIADDPFGNIIFLSAAGEDYGKVYFGNTELEVPETGYIVMSPIADTFTEFMDKLYLSE